MPEQAISNPTMCYGMMVWKPHATSFLLDKTSSLSLWNSLLILLFCSFFFLYSSRISDTINCPADEKVLVTIGNSLSIDWLAKKHLQESDIAKVWALSLKPVFSVNLAGMKSFVLSILRESKPIFTLKIN